MYTHLERSKKGVYFAAFIQDVLRVWILEESYGQTKWMFNGQYDLKPVRLFDRQAHGPWVLEDINYEFRHYQLP